VASTSLLDGSKPNVDDVRLKAIESSSPMGADFSSHWFFVGAADAAIARNAVVDGLHQALHEAGLQEVAREEDAESSLVVGPGDRWIFIGDSAGSTEWVDAEGFDALSLALSALGPVVDVKMSDSVAIHFYLYRQGRLVDQFGNAAFPFNRFATEEEAAAYRGRPELWADLLLSPDTVAALRSAWVQEWKASEILADTGRLLGWDPRLSWVGYSFDDEGVPLKYDEFLRHSEVALDTFSEYHFKHLR
jgi:hypothetical protein